VIESQNMHTKSSNMMQNTYSTSRTTYQSRPQTVPVHRPNRSHIPLTISVKKNLLDVLYELQSLPRSVSHAEEEIAQ
jgi:hypothetical protein